MKIRKLEFSYIIGRNSSYFVIRLIIIKFTKINWDINNNNNETSFL